MPIIEAFRNILDSILGFVGLLLYLGFSVGVMFAFVLLKVEDFIKNIVVGAIKKIKEKKKISRDKNI
jgi:hypothetical protein